MAEAAHPTTELGPRAACLAGGISLAGVTRVLGGRIALWNGCAWVTFFSRRHVA